MTARGPQHRLSVEVWRDDERVAAATCFFSAFEDDGGQRRWRGFLSDVDPAGSIEAGAYRLVLPSSGRADIEVTEVRTEPREQAIFRGRGEPPLIEDD
ncbi:MAG: hypothetical protein R3C39_15715 [Dehalococcoidia bacterium]